MRRGTLILLFFIILLGLSASYVNFWPNSGPNGQPWHGLPNPFVVKEGLDLKGGVRVLLVPDPKQHYTADQVNAAIPATIIQIGQRVNGGLGVNEPNIRQQTTNGLPSISVELPGLNSGNQLAQIQQLLKTGDLQFWDTGPSGNLAQGATFTPSAYTQYNPGDKPLFTGKDLDPSQLGVSQDPNQGNNYQINFGMKGDAIGRFSDFTAKHIGDALTIVLDGQVVSSPTIQSQIPGNGVITGKFSYDDAVSLVNVLKYGALPLVLVIQSEETVGATLGQDSILKSEIAAAIGLGIVILFMLLYYRLPGLLADIALILYALVTFAIFKVIGVVLTLAGIAGFILSIGMAVDANVLIFERVKEELRAGRLLASAIDIGWKRAWPSIRDSNISTLITCAVLYFFGSNFGATIIVGFATTLFLGVLVSMFTAVVVTRTFLNLLVPTGVVSHPALFGLPAGSIATASLARRNSTV
jgi:preprotein translocase subunit SecD